MGFLDAPTSQATAASLGGKVDKSSVVNVRDYGVVLDGSAATSTQLANAINAASLLGLPLRLPQGRYMLDQVSIPANMTIEGAGPNTVIVQRLPDKPTFQAVGTNGTLGALTEDLVKGATTINITQSWGLVAGDLILVVDNFSYASTDASYKSGEQFRVASSTGTSITLTTPVRGSFSNTGGSYTVANAATLQKITPVKNVTLRNMAFEGNAAGTTQMILFQYIDGLTLDGVSTVSAQAGFCTMDTVRNASVSNFTLNGLVDNWSTGYPGYGFIVRHACYNVRISDGVSNMARHSITTLGGPFGAPRNLVFGPNIISSDPSSTAAIDTHSAGEGVLIHGNTISFSTHGIAVRARNVTVKGNRISNTVNNGVLVNENGKDIVISNNDLVTCGGYGIRVGASGSTHSNVEIKNNTLTGSTGDAISAGAGQNDLRIVGNTSIRTNKYGIDVDASCTDVLISRNDVVDASLANTVPGINSTGTQAAGLFDIVGNTVKQKANLMNRAVYTTRTQGRITGNRGFGTFVSTGSEFYGATGVTLADNTLYA